MCIKIREYTPTADIPKDGCVEADVNVGLTSYRCAGKVVANVRGPKTRQAAVEEAVEDI